MQTYRLIKNIALELILLALVLLFTATTHAQTNGSFLNLSNMTVAPMGQNDVVMYGKWSGTKWVWNKLYNNDFWAGYTNSPTGQIMASNIVAHFSALVAGTNNLNNASNVLAAVNAAMQASQTAANAAWLAGLTQGTNNLNAASNILAAINANTASAGTAASNALWLSWSNVNFTATNTRANVTTISNLAANAVQAGGKGSFSSVTLSTQPTNNPTANIVIDFNAAAFFYATNLGSYAVRTVLLTNFVAGSSASLLVTSPNGIASDRFTYPTGVRNLVYTGNPIIIAGSSTAQAILFNFYCYGTNLTDVVMTGGAQLY